MPARSASGTRSKAKASPRRTRPSRSAPALARELLREADREGGILEGALDRFLAADRGYERRLDALLAAVKDRQLLPDPSTTPSGEPFRPRLPMLGSDQDLRRYLKQVSVHPKMDKPEEVRMARRMEFAQRRFHTAVHEAQLQSRRLREVLGDQYSRTFEHDLDLADTPNNAARLARKRQETIRRRAAELNRIRTQFVERNLPLVVDLAMGYRTYGVPVIDLVQEGNGALIRAVEKFDWRKDVRFQTYATFWVRQAIERCIAFNRGIVRVPNYLQQKMRRLRREGVLPRNSREVSIQDVSEAFSVKPEVAGHLLQTERSTYSLDVSVDEDGETFASLLADENVDADGPPLEFSLLKKRIEEVLDSLSELERQILELRFGLSGRDAMTLEEVGRQMNVSRERIRQLQVRAIRKLQRPGLIQRLAGFV